jgi:hypothetical protein
MKDTGSLKVTTPTDRELVMTRVNAWHKGDDKVLFACPACKHSSKFVAWEGPLAFGFGFPGLESWNWPPLKLEFVARISKLRGHRVVVVRNQSNGGAKRCRPSPFSRSTAPASPLLRASSTRSAVC